MGCNRAELEQMQKAQGLQSGQPEEGLAKV